jgi:glucose dehydrogenase
MNPRIKKLIGTLVMVVFVSLYALLVAALAPRFLTGGSKLVELGFYVVAGLAWALPLLPLIRWMEKRPS